MSNIEHIHHARLGISIPDVHSENSLPVLKNWKTEVEIDIQMMNIQIDEAKSKAWEGEYSPADWFRKINTKRRLYGVLVMKINQKISELKQKERERFEKAFIDVCYRELDEHLFHELKAMANAETQGHEEATEKVL